MGTFGCKLCVLRPQWLGWPLEGINLHLHVLEGSLCLVDFKKVNTRLFLLFILWEKRHTYPVILNLEGHTLKGLRLSTKDTLEEPNLNCSCICNLCSRQIILVLFTASPTARSKTRLMHGYEPLVVSKIPNVWEQIIPYLLNYRHHDQNLNRKRLKMAKWPNLLDTNSFPISSLNPHLRGLQSPPLQ